MTRRGGRCQSTRSARRCTRCRPSGTLIDLLAVSFRWTASTNGWQSGAQAKQPFAIAMKDGTPFGIGGIWENWRDPDSGEWVRAFAVITTAANELVGQMHD